MRKYKYIDRLIEQKTAIEQEDFSAIVEERVAEYRKTVEAEIKQSVDLALAQINLKIETAIEFANELEAEQEEMAADPEKEEVVETTEQVTDTAEETI